MRFVLPGSRIFLAIPILVLLAACGSDDSGDSSPVLNGEENGNGGANGDTDSSPGGSEVDLSNAPGPGAAQLEVDGQTFVVTDLSDCTASEAAWSVDGVGGEDADRVNIEAFGSQVGDRFTAQISVEVGGTLAYVSAGQRDGPPTVEGSRIGIAGEFFSREDDDSLESVGEGVLLANCE